MLEVFGQHIIMSPLRRHIFVCFMAKGGFFAPSSVKRGRTHIVLDEICSVPPPLHILKIWGAWVYSPRSYGAEFVCFFCLSITLLLGQLYTATSRVNIDRNITWAWLWENPWQWSKYVNRMRCNTSQCVSRKQVQGLNFRLVLQYDTILYGTNDVH